MGVLKKKWHLTEEIPEILFTFYKGLKISLLIKLLWKQC